jgi:1,4-dihydroxy-2-naphthoyl-CoA hydrolase
MCFSYFRMIRLADTDAAGVVYFSNLLSICHEAYEDYVSSSYIDFRDLVYHGSIALPIVHSEIDFFKPIYCGDRILINVKIEIIKTGKFGVNYEIHEELTPDTILAKAKTHHVCIDKKTRKRIEFPDPIRKFLDKESS